MYFNIRELLRIEKEGLNRIHRQVDIRDYWEVRTGKVIAFTSFQNFYIQEQFNCIYDLNQRDCIEYTNHEEINGNIYDFDHITDNPEPERKQRKGDSITEEHTKRELLRGWSEFVLENNILSISNPIFPTPIKMDQKNILDDPIPCMQSPILPTLSSSLISTTSKLILPNPSIRSLPSLQWRHDAFMISPAMPALSASTTATASLVCPMEDRLMPLTTSLIPGLGRQV